MLEHIFLKILNMSLTASIIIVIVMIARIFLKRYPKYISYALWSVVLFRLICPFSIETSISVVPNSDTLLSDNMLSHSTLENEIIEDNVNTINREQTDFPTVDSETELGYATTVKANPVEKFIFMGKYIWLAGIAVMLTYCVLSAIKIRRKVQISVKLKDNIYIADEMISPFVMGVIRPKIYLPYCLSEKEQKYIIMHEQYHIMRFDHVIKMVSFIALSLHWFNPFVWVAFILSGKDMEMSCDEAVIEALGVGIRADYSASLLAIATGYKGRNGFPVSFGESDTKTRIKNIANMRTVKKSVLAVVTVAVIVLTVYLATNRSSSSGDMATNEENEAFENSWDSYLGTASQMTEFVDNIKQYLTDGDMEAIYNNMASQINVYTEQINGTISLDSIEQLSQYYGDIFNDEVCTEILEVDSTDVWASWRGVCVGNGCLWLQPLTENGNCIGYEISAVNQLNYDIGISETISLADQWINECEAVGYSEDDAKKLYAKMEQDGVNLDENYEITDIRFGDFDSNSEEDWLYILRVRNGVITNETFESGWLIIYMNGSLAYKIVPPSYTFEKLSQFDYGDLDNDGIIEINYTVSLGGSVETDSLYKEELKYINGKLEVQ